MVTQNLWLHFHHHHHQRCLSKDEPCATEHVIVSNHMEQMMTDTRDL